MNSSRWETVDVSGCTPRMLSNRKAKQKYSTTWPTTALLGPSISQISRTLGTLPAGGRTYVCYNETNICPIDSALNMAEELCGNDCYSRLEYDCDNSIISTPSVYNGPIVLRAFNVTANFSGQALQANDGYFQIGGQNSAIGCPDHYHDCQKVYNETVLVNGHDLRVQGPIKQRAYIQRDGSFAYSRNSEMPDKLMYGTEDAGVALETGLYMVLGHRLWNACRDGPDALPRIYANTPGFATKEDEDMLDCESVYIQALPLSGDHYGPYQFA